MNGKAKKMLEVNKLKIMNHKLFEYQTKEIKRAINDEGLASMILII